MKAYCKRHKITIVVMLVSVLIFFSVVPQTSAQVGSVIINNYTDFWVTITVPQVDFFGYQNWQPMAQIAPGSNINIPKVPFLLEHKRELQ